MSDKVTPLMALRKQINALAEAGNSRLSMADIRRLIDLNMPAEREFASELFYANRECGDFNTYYSQFNQQEK